YDGRLPKPVRRVLEEFADNEKARRTKSDQAALWIQAVAAVILVFGLAFHIAEVGLIGLLVIILITSFTGVTDEHQIGKAFQESLQRGKGQGFLKRLTRLVRRFRNPCPLPRCWWCSSRW